MHHLQQHAHILSGAAALHGTRLRESANITLGFAGSAHTALKGEFNRLTIDNL